MKKIYTIVLFVFVTLLSSQQIFAQIKQKSDHDDKNNKRRTAVTDQWQGYPNDRTKPQRHSHIDQHLQSQDPDDPDGDLGPKLVFDLLGNQQTAID